MEINREDLVKCLRQIAPTIGDKSPLDQLKCYWFDGARAWTFNEIVATEVPFGVELQGGISQQFLGLIENSTAVDIKLTITGNELEFSAGRTKGKIPIRGMDEAIQPFPPDDAGRTAQVVLTAVAEAALRHVNVNAGDSGVTLVKEDEELAFYSTDHKSISWARIPLPEDYNVPRLLLSPQFCQRLQVAMEGTEAVLEILDDRVIVLAKAVRLFGRITVEEHPRPFHDAILNSLPEDGFIDVPVGMAEALRRVQVLVHPSQQDRIRMTLDGDVMNLYFKSALGEVNDTFDIEGNTRTVEVYFEPELLKTGFTMMTPSVIAIADRAFAMMDDRGFGYIMSASPKPE